MLTVACVNVSDYLGRGQEYVAKMRAMVARNLSQPYRFECITESDKPGWWAKVDLFEPGRFSGRVLGLDLDSVITGPLDELVANKGIIYLDDWGWESRVYGASLMVWDAGEHSEIFEQYDASVPERFEGDQDWLTHFGGWDGIPAHMARSYRYHCVDGVPAGCVHVSCHGHPKPHEILTGWVPEVWRE